MRLHIKNNIINMLETVFEIHALLSANTSKCEEFLPLCSSAMQSMKTSLDNHENTNAINVATEYIEFTQRIEDNVNNNIEDIIKLNDLAHIFSQEILNIITKKHVVFFPYNASMWDSMESVYLACVQDENCECFVVPIPYYRFDSKTQKWNETYEGHMFPKEIPISHYSLYSLEKNLPDVAYIHNPYDEFNRVTRVQEDYYSYNLKKYVNILVYIPYYVNGGKKEKSYKLSLPVFNYADYIIVQSDQICEWFSNTNCKDKIVALGSPKFDRVISLDKSGVNTPEEWQNTINGRKTLMLNLTISTLLTWQESVLEKLKELFDCTKELDTVIIWRPHPLLLATIDSMIPHLKNAYTSLLSYFKTIDNGILDTTADITKAVTIADGYIGCVSSVMYLFRAVQKPVFLLDYISMKGKSDNLQVSSIREYGDNYICPLDFNTAYMVLNKNFEYKNILWVKNEDLLFTCAHNDVLCDGNDLYTSYIESESLLKYNHSENTLQIITPEGVSFSGYTLICKHEQKLIFAPYTENSILIYNKKLKTVQKKHKAIKDFKANCDPNIISPTVAFSQICGDFLYMGAYNTGDILQYNLQSGDYKILKTGDNGFSSLYVENGILWLAEINTGDIISLNILTKKVHRYKMPEELQLYSNVQNPFIIHRSIFKIGDLIITFPWAAKCMTKLNINEKSATLYNESLFSTNRSKISKMPMSGFASKNHNDIIIAQRQSDLQLLTIDLKADKIDELKLIIPDKELVSLKNKHIDYLKRHCFTKESLFFSAQDFIREFSKEDFVLSETQKSKKVFANNLDGTCGEKIHAYVMEEYKKQLGDI